MHGPVFGSDDGDDEDGLDGRLVPAGEAASGVCCLKLGRSATTHIAVDGIFSEVEAPHLQ